MVKIKKLSMILGIFLAVLMAPIVLADNENVGTVVSGGKLLITDVDVKVGSKTDKNLGDGDKIRDEAKPGDRVEFTIKLYNNFTDNDDVDIEDIQLQVTIEGIDDDDDIEEEAKSFDLTSDNDKKVTVSFDIPLEVDEDTFDVLIEADGDSDNGSQEVQMDLSLEVQKEDDEVRFLRNTLSPSEVKCGRTVQLSTAVINTGSNEQEESLLEVSNAGLGISFRETFDLTDSPFDEDSKFSKAFTFTVPGDAAAGVYSMLSKITYNDGKDSETETADLVVAKCEVLEEQPKEEEAKDEIVVVQPPAAQPTVPTGSATAQPVTAPILAAAKEEKSLFQSTGFLAALVAGEVLLVIVAILIVVAVIRKRS